MDTSGFLHQSCIVSALLVSLIDVSQSVPPEYCLHKLNTSDCRGPPTPVAYYYKPGSRCEIAIWRGCPTYNKFNDEVICSHICLAKGWQSEESQSEFPEYEYDEFEEWEKEIESLPPEEIEIVDTILEQLLAGNGTTLKKNKLKHVKNETTEASDITTIENEASETDSISTLTDITTYASIGTTPVKEVVTTTEAATTQATTTTTPEITTTTEATTTEVITLATTTIDPAAGSAEEVITT